MQRILLLLAFVIAVGVTSAAVVELNSRTAETNSGLPAQRVPSPSAAPAPTPERSPRSAPSATVGPNEASSSEPAPTAIRTEAAPAPSPTGTVAPTTTTPATPTAEPPATPSPSPELTAGPIDTSRGPTPHTGGGAGNGVIIAAFALAARFVLNRRRRT